MITTIAKVVNTTKLVKAVLRSKEFDNALSLASYKLTRIKFKEHNALLDLKRAYNKEKLNITKLATADRKEAIKCFFDECKAICKAKEQNNTANVCKGQVVTVLDY